MKTGIKIVQLTARHEAMLLNSHFSLLPLKLRSIRLCAWITEQANVCAAAFTPTRKCPDLCLSVCLSVCNPFRPELSVMWYLCLQVVTPVATAAGEDGNMVAVALPLCFFIQTLVTFITAQNPGKCSTQFLINTATYPEQGVRFYFAENLRKNINICV